MSTRFFTALAALVAMLAAVALLGLLGLKSVEHANNQVFDDNFRTAQATSDFIGDVGEVQRMTLEIASSDELARVEQLRAALATAVLPDVNQDIAGLLRLHADDPRDEFKEIERLAAYWSSFRNFAQEGEFVADGHLPTAAERASAVARSENVLDPLLAQAAV
ncbi:MAG TPA: hypothetical protein VH025_00255, partial [Solirubrobacteraceae bacterium]|nr:hypothetical protein [Solirubrobacteraceae bacterium]